MATKKTAAKKSVAKTAAAKKKTATKSTGSKSAAKKVPAKKTAAKRTAAKRTSSKKTAAKKTAGKKTAGTSAAKKSSASKSKSNDNYTKPELREKIKDEVMAGDKGGRPGQWSARKAQLVAHEYTAEGGGYKHPRNDAQEHLKQWGDEKWHTADGKPAIEGDTTHRYLPDKAWNELSPAEKKATEEKKVRGSRKGKQHVANTDSAKEARKHAEKG